jgi:hypothetical protein
VVMSSLTALRKPLVALILLFSALAVADTAPLRASEKTLISKLSTGQIEEQLQVGCTILLDCMQNVVFNFGPADELVVL